MKVFLVYYYYFNILILFLKNIEYYLERPRAPELYVKVFVTVLTISCFPEL